MQIPADDYPALKAFFVWTTENVIEPSLGFPSGAVASLESFETQSASTARKGLSVAIGDLLEDLSELTAEQVETIDAALRADGIVTLTEVRARSWSKIRRIRRRRLVRDDGEYYALRNVVEALPEDARPEAWSLLSAYEQKAVR